MWNKIKHVFTKEYRMELEYQDFLRSSLPHFKLKTKSESVNTIVDRLIGKRFVSNFKLYKRG